MQYYAHTRTAEDGTLQLQTAKDHCLNVAKLASKRLKSVRLDKVSYLAGLLHDMGKFKEEYQNYLLEHKGRKGTVIHSFAGAKYILDTFRKEHDGDKGDDEKDITAEIIAYAIGAHHGMFDLQNSSGTNGFAHRREAQNISYEESCKVFEKECMALSEVNQLFCESAEQIKSILNTIVDLLQDAEAADGEIAFFCGLLQRLVLSAVIDADRTDTAIFNSGKALSLQESLPDWGMILKQIEKKLDAYPCDRPIERMRRNISDQCRKQADYPGGILRLNVPTGGGKTLSSLRYAVAHAKHYGKQRIIFTAPMLTILEQNAAEIKNIVGKDKVFEHHSNVVHFDSNKEDLDEYEELAVKWNASIIVTSMTQLLNTIYSGKTASIRRFQSLCNSVIVIDEVQAVPIKMLSLFNLAISFLSEIAGATVVLCSATQPCLENVEHTFCSEPRNIVTLTDTERRVFKRTRILDAGLFNFNEISNFADDILKNKNSLLIVCNKKSEAEKLYFQMKSSYPNCFHLSASMCLDHRREVLESVYGCLKKKEKTVCISTQVIEAGVNISFDSVIRLAAGLDSIVQSAGRCNRHAENEELSYVYVLRIVDENLSMLKEIKQGKAATMSLLEQFKKAPEHFDDDLASDKAVNFYYRELYRNLNKSATEYPLESDTIFNLLGQNTHYCNSQVSYYFQQAFKTAGDSFEVFDSPCIDVIVPYGNGKQLIEDVQSKQAKKSFTFLQECIHKASAVTVAIYDYQRKQLEEMNGLYWICDNKIAVLEESFYDINTGVSIKGKAMDYLEV